MDIKNFFSGMLGGKPQDVLHTPYGDINLAKGPDRKRVKKMVIELQRATDALTRKDIADWRYAWQTAINVDNPDRRRLYDIYRDVEIDLHLSGCVKQREGFVMAKSFKLVDASGNENKEAHHYFDQSWFKQLLKFALEANNWGHSLIELGDVTTDGDGCVCYTDVRLINRKHVIPEYGRVVQQLGQDWTSGIDYHSAPFTDWLIEAGRPDDLGLYLKAATQTIPKKNMLAFWDTFGEIFGMPMRIARTTTRDDNERHRIEAMLRDAGTNQYMVASQDTEIEFVESGKGDAFNVYDKRIDRANSELSKLIIGQTMTIEDGSSLSQSETHLEVFQNLVESDCDMLRDIVNNQLIPRMVKHGFPIKGLRFEWDDAADYTPEQQVAYETMVADRYEVDPSYFAEKYSMPVGERRNAQPILPAGGDDEDDEPNDEGEEEKGGKKKQPKNARPSFFRLSPADYAGLHQRYDSILGNDTLTLASPINDALRDELGKKFEKMMSVLFKQEGANLDIGILASDEAQDFISTHASALDSSFKKVEMSDAMRSRLQRSDYIFSGMKTFHELNEAFPSLLDENGNRKSFEAFLNDVQKIDKTYNSHYLRAEYNFVQSSANMAAKWERFSEDGDRYNLQYRTAGDGKVRPEHAALNGVTLPPSDPFWEEYYPPNGWNCRCTVVQVRKSKYPETPHDDAMALGEEALQRDTKGIFHFNPGKEDKTVPDYNPYTIRRCRDCDIAKGELNLTFIPDNELCQACKLVHKCFKDKTRKSEIKRIEGNKKLYDKLSKDKHYKDIEFDVQTGALKASHIGHNTGSDKGFKLEEKLIDGLYSCGHSIILCDEKKKGRDGNVLVSLDMILDGVRMDIKSITKNKNFYGGPIKEKNKQLVKFNHRSDVHEPADTLCLYFDDPTMFAPEKITKGYEYMLSKTSGEVALRHILCAINSNKGLEIKTFDFP